MKRYYLRILTHDDFSSNTYVRWFDSISSVLTYIIREYGLSEIDSINIDDFDISTQVVDSEDVSSYFSRFPFFKLGD